MLFRILTGMLMIRQARDFRKDIGISPERGKEITNHKERKEKQANTSGAKVKQDSWAEGNWPHMLYMPHISTLTVLTAAHPSDDFNICAIENEQR